MDWEQMLDRTEDVAAAVDNWLAQFEEALAKSDGGLLKTLFHPTVIGATCWR